MIGFLLLAFLIGPVALRAGPVPKFSAVNLGVLPGMTGTAALDISDCGEVVGYCGASTEGQQRAFLWKNGVISPVAPGGLRGWTRSQATGINCRGDIALTFYALIKQPPYEF